MATNLREERPLDDSDEAVEEVKIASGKRGLPIKAIIAVLVVAIILVGAFFGYKIIRKHLHLKAAPVVEKVGDVVALDEFMMNLSDDGGQQHYIKTIIALGLKQGVAGDKFKDLVPQSRDAIIMVLSQKKLSDVDTIAGKLQLKQDIKNAVNASVGDDDVLDVYYEEFATQ